jgi:hypothetical protein
VAGPLGVALPRFDKQSLAFIGSVVGHTTSEQGFPALMVKVLEPWTPAQEQGEVIHVSVADWSCTSQPTPHSAFRPAEYPVGTRVRVISPGKLVYSWDLQSSITVLGAAL